MIIDWLVVVLATILNMVIGLVWYSKWMFGPLRKELSKFSEKKFRGGLKMFLFGSIVSFLISLTLYILESSLQVTTVTDGMVVGFLLWLGLVMTTQISAVIWTKQPFRLFLIDTGEKLLSFLAISGLMGA